MSAKAEKSEDRVNGHCPSTYAEADSSSMSPCTDLAHAYRDVKMALLLLPEAQRARRARLMARAALMNVRSMEGPRSASELAYALADELAVL